MDPLVAQVLASVEAQAWDEMRLLLHPYLHWSGRNGVTLRGRSKVMQWLADSQPRLTPPARIELRDGQIYRWVQSE